MVEAGRKIAAQHTGSTPLLDKQGVTCDLIHRIDRPAVANLWSLPQEVARDAEDWLRRHDPARLPQGAELPLPGEPKAGDAR